jgi:basic amino acid/polyamine antiporter, APA family
MLAYPVVPAAYRAGTGLLTAAVFYERPVVSAISLLNIAAVVPVY